MSAIAQSPYGKNVASPGIPDLMRDAVAECLAVAQAEGVPIPGDIHAAVQRIGVSMASPSTSTAQDLAREKPTEIDYLNGLIVRLGQAHGITTPVNRTLWVLVKPLEGRGVAVAGRA